MKPIESLNMWGLWDVPNIKVRFISDRWVQFSCEHRVVNGSKEHKNVYLSLFERLRGESIDSKAVVELEKFKEKYRQKNETILRLREKEKRFQ